MADFFIRRPIVAMVISILIVLLGLNTLRGLSFEQYPLRGEVARWWVMAVGYYSPLR